MRTKPFVVLAVSLNTNSFGLRAFVAVAEDGTAFEAAANSLNAPEQNQRLTLGLDPGGTVNYAAHGYEIARELASAPPELTKPLFDPK